MIKTLKANGENCQISYNSEFSVWAVASKNVCLVAEFSEDLKFYKNVNRYSFAYLMADCWFRFLEMLP